MKIKLQQKDKRARLWVIALVALVLSAAAIFPLYRVLAQGNSPPSKSAGDASEESSPALSYEELKALRTLELAVIKGIIADGPQAQPTLAKTLAETEVPAEFILDLLKTLRPEQLWARIDILEAVVLKPGQLTPKALARARILLAGEFLSAGRHADSVNQYLAVVRAEPTRLQTCEAWVGAGRVYQFQENHAEALRCWEIAAQFTDAARWPEEAQWLIALNCYHRRDYSRALDECTKLVESPYPGMFKAAGYFWMGETLRSLGRLDEAEQAYRKAIELKNASPLPASFRYQYEVAAKRAEMRLSPGPLNLYSASR